MKDGVVAVGFDPGLAVTGYGVVRSVGQAWEAVSGGVIETSPDLSRTERLKEIHDEARSIIKEHEPVGIAIERVFMAKNARTAMLTAETRGVLLLACTGFPACGYTPLQVKKRITGYGRATKAQVQQMVKKLLNLSEVPKPDDVGGWTSFVFVLPD